MLVRENADFRGGTDVWLEVTGSFEARLRPAGRIGADEWAWIDELRRAPPRPTAPDAHNPWTEEGGKVSRAIGWCRPIMKRWSLLVSVSGGCEMILALWGSRFRVDSSKR